METLEQLKEEIINCIKKDAVDIQELIGICQWATGRAVKLQIEEETGAIYPESFIR